MFKLKDLRVRSQERLIENILLDMHAIVDNVEKKYVNGIIFYLFNLVVFLIYYFLIEILELDLEFLTRQYLYSPTTLRKKLIATKMLSSLESLFNSPTTKSSSWFLDIVQQHISSVDSLVLILYFILFNLSLFYYYCFLLFIYFCRR